MLAYTILSPVLGKETYPGFGVDRYSVLICNLTGRYGIIKQIERFVVRVMKTRAVKSTDLQK